jgi:hypothetical protein
MAQISRYGRFVPETRQRVGADIAQYFDGDRSADRGIVRAVNAPKATTAQLALNLVSTDFARWLFRHNYHWELTISIGLQL